MVKTRVIRLRVIQGPNARDQSAFHTFLVEVQTNAGYIHVIRNNNLEIKGRRLLLSPAITYTRKLISVHRIEKL